MHRSSKAKIVRSGGWTSEFVESCDERYDRKGKLEDYDTDDKATDYDDEDDDDDASIDLIQQENENTADDGHLRRPLPLVTPSNPRSRLDLTLSRDSHRKLTLSSSQSVNGPLGRRLDRSYFTPQLNRGTSASLSDIRDYRQDRNHSSMSSGLLSSTFTPNLVSKKEPARTLGDFLNQTRGDETDGAPGSGSGDESDDDDATFFSMFQWSKTGDNGASSSVQQSSDKKNVSSSRSVGGRSLGGDVRYSSQQPKKSIKGSASVADIPKNDSSLRPSGSRSAYRGLYARSLEEDAAALSQGKQHSSQESSRPALTRSVKGSESRGWQSSPEDGHDDVIDTKHHRSTITSKTDTKGDGRRPAMLQREVSERFDRFLLEKEKERRRRHRRDRDPPRNGERSHTRKESSSGREDRKHRRRSSRDAASTRSSNRNSLKSKLEDQSQRRESKRGEEDDTATTMSMTSQARERGSRDNERTSGDRRSRKDKTEKDERDRTRHSRRGHATDDEGRRKDEPRRRRSDRRSFREETEDEQGGDGGRADDKKIRHRSSKDFFEEPSSRRRSSHKSRTDDVDDNEDGRRAEEASRKIYSHRSSRESIDVDREGKRGEESSRRRSSHRSSKDDVNKDEDIERTEDSRRRRSDKRSSKDDGKEEAEGRGSKESSKRHSNRRSGTEDPNEEELNGRHEEEVSRRRRSHRSADRHDRDVERRLRSSSRTRDSKNRSRDDSQDDVERRPHRTSSKRRSRRSTKDDDDTVDHPKSEGRRSSRRTKEEGSIEEDRTERRRNSSKRHSDQRSVDGKEGKVSSRRHRSNSRNVPSRRSARSKDPTEDHGRRRRGRSTEGDTEPPSNHYSRRSSRSDYDLDSQYDSNSDVGSNRSKSPNKQTDDITVIQFDPTKHDNIDQVMTSKGSSIEIENLDGSWSIAHIREMPVTPNVGKQQQQQYFLSDSVTASMTSQESSVGLSTTASTGRAAMRLLSTCLSNRLLSQTFVSELQPKNRYRRRSYSDDLNEEKEGQYRRRKGGITPIQNRNSSGVNSKNTTIIPATKSQQCDIQDSRRKMTQSTGRAESVLRRSFLY